jgi:ABC-type phosphate transport system permease subunit
VHGAEGYGEHALSGGATMRIVITFRTIFNLLVIAILIGIAAGVYL